MKISISGKFIILLVAFFGFFSFALTVSAQTGSCASSTIISDYQGAVDGYSTAGWAYNRYIGFEVSTSTNFTVCSVDIYGRRGTTLGTFFLEIASDLVSNTNRTIYTTVNFSNSVFGTTNAWKNIAFSSPVDLEPNTLYYVNVSATQNNASYIRWSWDTTTTGYPYFWYLTVTKQTGSDLLFRVNGTAFTPAATSSTSTLNYAIITPMPEILSQTCVTVDATTTCALQYSTTTTTYLDASTLSLLFLFAFVSTWIFAYLTYKFI